MLPLLTASRESLIFSTMTAGILDDDDPPSSIPHRQFRTPCHTQGATLGDTRIACVHTLAEWAIITVSRSDGPSISVVELLDSAPAAPTIASWTKNAAVSGCAIRSGRETAPSPDLERGSAPRSQAFRRAQAGSSCATADGRYLRPVARFRRRALRPGRWSPHRIDVRPALTDWRPRQEPGRRRRRFRSRRC